MKSGMEQQAYRMADKLVPISFIGAGLTYLLTRNVMKALSFVMVDFSCALKIIHSIGSTFRYARSI